MSKKFTLSYVLENIKKKDDKEKWFKENITVKEYIPIKEKFSIISLFKNDYYINFLYFDNMKENYNDEYILLKYEIYKLYNLFFKYTNIIIPDDMKTEETYDKIINSELYKYIYNICGKDYIVLEKYCDNVININTIIFSDIISNIFKNIPTLDDAKKIKKEINSINKEKLSILSDISMYNSINKIKKVKM